MHNPKSQNCDRVSVTDARYFNAESVTQYKGLTIGTSVVMVRIVSLFDVASGTLA